MEITIACRHERILPQHVSRETCYLREMRILDQLQREIRRSGDVVQEAADAHQVAAKRLAETGEAMTTALIAVALVAVIALGIAAYAVIKK